MGGYAKVIDTASVFYQTIMQLSKNPMVREMQKLSHHKVTNTYAHCLNVAECSYMLALRFHIKIDEKSLAMGAMLHDFYLYNFRAQEKIGGYEHLTKHPSYALANAKNYFVVTDRVENIIASHMWPLTITKLPKSKEAVLVCVADKICAFKELALGKQRKAPCYMEYETHGNKRKVLPPNKLKQKRV